MNSMWPRSWQSCGVATQQIFSLRSKPVCVNLRLLKTAGQKGPTAVPVLEINPQHALIRRLETETDERLPDWANLLFDEAMLAEGAQLADPAAFVRRLNALMFGVAEPAAAASAADEGAAQ